VSVFGRWGGFFFYSEVWRRDVFGEVSGWLERFFVSVGGSGPVSGLGLRCEGFCFFSFCSLFWRFRGGGFGGQ